MKIYGTYSFTGRAQQWKVPAGVTEAVFECWGASGGMSSTLVVNGRVNETRSTSGDRNIDFTNRNSAGLGRSYANGSGYAKGRKTVKEGEVYWVYVGGNGGPGRSAIRERADHTFAWSATGGTGGWNGGASGGRGALVFKNLFNSDTTKVNFTQTGMPGSASAGQLWHDTDAHLVRKCKKTYSSGGSISNNWVTVTDTHPHAVGPSGGGGGGATDIRTGSDATKRILVAGGGGGSAGPWNRTGPDVWALSACPDTPAPPFGSDVTTATGVNSTWASSTNYFSSGWGLGGCGGAGGPGAGQQPTVNSGSATQGGNGGAASGRHREGSITTAVSASGGNGGTNLVGGRGGRGGGVDGDTVVGGAGAAATGGHDDWCAGGGGGGGGYYGGGGGGQGFRVGWDSYEIATFGGGGGGGSNYASPLLSEVLLTGGARPPAPSTSKPTGANGAGGFARITYALPPKVSLVAPSAVSFVGQPYSLTFRYSPALDSGAPIESYVVGTSADPDATAPTTVSTISARSTETEFTHAFATSPADGVTWAYFVKVVDTDGDSSPWTKQKVRGRTLPAPATITSPASGSIFTDTATVAWSIGGQTPLVAYRLGMLGIGLDGEPVDIRPEGWIPGGSRVNLAPDPGFKTTAIWSGSGGAGSLTSSTTYPGVSGSSGRISWAAAAPSAPTLLQRSMEIDSLIPGERYRMALNVASATANDTRQVRVSVARPDGVSIASTTVDLSAAAAGAYVLADLEFTPQTQSVTVEIQPTDSSGDFGMADVGQITHLTDWLIELAPTPRALFTDDFEDGISRWEAESGSPTLGVSPEFNTGGQSLGVTATGATSVVRQTAASRVPCAPGQIARVQVSASQQGAATLRSFTAGVVFYDGAGVVIGAAHVSPAKTFTALDSWVTAEVTWGPAPAGTVAVGAQVSISGAAADAFSIDDVSVSVGAPGAYFDGTNLNGNGGSVSWKGAVNASPSLLTGTDILSDTLTVQDVRLLGAQVYLDTLDDDAVAYGGRPSRSLLSVVANPSTPATPEVELQVDRDAGVMRLLLDADDAAVSNKTVYFDIFRNGVRVAHRLIPEQVTRSAVFEDVPGHAEQATYVVRAFDDGGGYTDQSDGTVVYT